VLVLVLVLGRALGRVLVHGHVLALVFVSSSRLPRASGSRKRGPGFAAFRCGPRFLFTLRPEGGWMRNRYEFGHERMDVYVVALQVAQWAAKQVLPPGRKHLQDQLVRAADSMVLNIAEGCGLEPGAARRHHFRIAMGSASEAGAALDLAQLPQGAQRQAELRRVAAMLSRLGRV